jgi:hypothetical protein
MRPSAVLIWILGLALLPPARAAPPPIAQLRSTICSSPSRTPVVSSIAMALVRLEEGTIAPAVQVRDTLRKRPNQNRRGLHRERRHA